MNILSLCTANSFFARLRAITWCLLACSLWRRSLPKSEEEIATAVAATLGQIRTRIEVFLALPLKQLNGMLWHSYSVLTAEQVSYISQFDPLVVIARS